MNIIRISILFFILQSLFPIVNACNNAIVWSEDFKLTWAHFQGNAPEDEPEKSARLYVGLYIEESTLGRFPEFIVFARIYPVKSWSRDTTSNILLMHEKLHFDITELFARKIRKAVIELRDDKVFNVNEYDNVMQMKFAEFASFQDLYDKKTNHGTLILKQIEWNEKISKELDLLSDYKLE